MPPEEAPITEARRQLADTLRRRLAEDIADALQHGLYTPAELHALVDQAVREGEDPT